jgi:hypothetical protein
MWNGKISSGECILRSCARSLVVLLLCHTLSIYSLPFSPSHPSTGSFQTLSTSIFQGPQQYYAAAHCGARRATVPILVHRVFTFRETTNDPSVSLLSLERPAARNNLLAMQASKPFTHTVHSAAAQTLGESIEEKSNDTSYDCSRIVRLRVSHHKTTRRRRLVNHTQRNDEQLRRVYKIMNADFAAANNISFPSEIPDFYLLEDYQHLFHGVEDEHEEADVKIEGTLPSELNGIYYLNGPGMLTQDNSPVHPFDGHGLIRRFELDGTNGRARYKSRFVRTRSFEKEKAAALLRDKHSPVLTGRMPLLHRGIGTNVDMKGSVLSGKQPNTRKQETLTETSCVLSQKAESAIFKPNMNP